MSIGDQIGARIREKRVQLRIRQSQLAKMVGVSPSYLNLIEHNRRRIGGKLLTDLAEALAIDIDLLSEDGKSSKVARLEEAAHYHKVETQAESARELATRFPAWSSFLIELDRNVRSLEAKIDALSDRLSHDPRWMRAARVWLLQVVQKAIRAAHCVCTAIMGLILAWPMIAPYSHQNPHLILIRILQWHHWLRVTRFRATRKKLMHSNQIRTRWMPRITLSMKSLKSQA